MLKFILLLMGLMALRLLFDFIDSSIKQKKKARRRRGRTGRSSKPATLPQPKTARPDEIILTSPLSKLSGSDFERLLALYFRDLGYTVNEVGVGGSDGGVDLVIIDRRGEKTAVQAKCYNDNNKVPVMTVRELVGAKRNHDCILALLITTSDLTPSAKEEAEKMKVEYWHGASLLNKLKKWIRWKGTA